MMKTISQSMAYLLISLALIANGCSSNNSNSLNISLSNNIKSSSASKLILTPKLGKSRSLSPDFICYNVNSTQVADWQDKSFTNAVNQLNPSLLRLPGGDVGNYWDWERGGLIENITSLPAGLPFFLRFKARQYTAGKLADFKASLVKTNTKPIWVLNMLTSDLESQLKMLKQAQKMGMSVNYIELGNEFYFNIPNYKKVFPNPRAYGLEAEVWAQAIRQEFPAAEIAVIGIVPTPNKPPRLQHWNKVMRGTALPTADAITLHIYNGHGLDDKLSPTYNYPYFEEQDIPVILGQPFNNWQQLTRDKNYQAIPDDKEIWITEYNLFEDLFPDGKDRPQPRVAGSWAHGLYNLSTSLLFLEESRITNICNHSLTESSIFGAILNASDSFINPNNKYMLTEPMSLSATGSALSMFGTATQNMTAAAPIKFASTTQLTGKNNFNYPSLYGWKFSRENDHQGIILNLSNQTQTIDISKLFNRASYQQLSGSPRTLVNNPEVLTQTSGEVQDSLKLSAYSVTRIYSKTPN